MFQLVCQATVQAERLQLQPDEPEAVIVKKDEQARGALRTREAMPRYQTCSIETDTHSEINATLLSPRVSIFWSNDRNPSRYSFLLVHKTEAHLDCPLTSALLEFKL